MVHGLLHFYKVEDGLITGLYTYNFIYVTIHMELKLVLALWFTTTLNFCPFSYIVRVSKSIWEGCVILQWLVHSLK